MAKTYGCVPFAPSPWSINMLYRDIFLFILERSPFHVICVHTLTIEITVYKVIWSKSTMFRCDFVFNKILESWIKHAQNTCHFCLQIVPIKVGKDRWLCPICSKSMKYKQHVQRHILIHTGEKPYFCNDCNFSSSRSDKLKAHVKLKHNC